LCSPIPVGALRRLLHWLFLLAATLPIFASPESDFQSANKLYDDGKFSEAITLYETIEPKTAHVFFNLGNACFLAGQRGRAVLNYERAKRLSPRDPDILANLKFAQEQLGVDAANAKPGAMAKLAETVAFRRTVNEWSTQEIIAVWFTALAVGIAIWLPRTRQVLSWVAAVAFLWSALSFTALGYRLVRHRSAPTAVVLHSTAEARFAPLADATVHFKLVEGTKISVRENRGQWLLVERADKQQGWVKKEVVERVGVQ
jgi:tetratricopeptide (TPR) repeat protein